MKIGKYISLGLMFLMITILIYGMINGNFINEGMVILSLPWGQAISVDLYVGFSIIIIWIFYRENNLTDKLIWSLSILILGNLITAMYLYVLFSNSNNLSEFFHGRPLIKKDKKKIVL
jgi:hypothetical protein